MSITEKTKVNLSSIRVTKETIKQVCQFLEQQVSDIKKQGDEDDKFSEISFLLETRNKTIEANSSEAFLNANWTKQISEIRIRYSGSIDIIITIEFGSSPLHYFSVSGKNTVIVNGITSKLEEAFSQNHTRNYLFHKMPFIVPISLIIGTIVGMGAHFVYEVYLKHNTHFQFPTGSSFILAIPLSFVTGWFLSWIFPETEFEDHLIQTKIRKGLIPVLITIIVTLVGSAIWKVITG